MTEPQRIILQASGLQFSYPGASLFKDLSVAIPAGVTLVLGGDGRGKSSLLRLLAGTLTAESGTLRIHGSSLATEGDAYRRQLFWIEAREERHDQITPRAFFTAQKSHHAGFDENRLAALTAGLSLTSHLDKQLYMLSTGSKRKVWLAAALASNAPVVLLDDPCAGLDRASINFFFDQLRLSSKDSNQAWVMAMYATPADLPLATVVELGE